MEHKHFDLDGLLRASYGLEAEGGGCPECRAAVERITRQRSEPGVEDNLQEWFWLRQNRAIQEAAQEAGLRPARRRWIGIAALAGVLAAALLAIQPPPNSPARISTEDERLWQEVSATVNRVEPQALAPMDLLWAQ
jgi:hypothetical protein